MQGCYFHFFLYERLLLLLICTWKNAIELLLHISRAQKKNWSSQPHKKNIVHS